MSGGGRVLLCGAICGALVAWRQPVDVDGWTIFGAHTDSPNLRVRPDPIAEEAWIFPTWVGGLWCVLLSTWFDRDLSLAGKGRDCK